MTKIIQRILSFSMKNAGALCVLSAVWMGLAVWCYFTLPVSLLPDLKFPILSIIIENPTLTSEEMERQATHPVEAAMSGISGVTHVRSESVSASRKTSRTSILLGSVILARSRWSAWRWWRTWIVTPPESGDATCPNDRIIPIPNAIPCCLRNQSDQAA